MSAAQESSDDGIEGARQQFWDTVRDGPVFICSSCHQTWFWKSVRAVTESLVSKVSRSGYAAALSDVSEWVCETCYRYLCQGKVPPDSHLHYEPFENLPEELLDLSAVEKNLIALRLPFMKLRVLSPSVRGGSKKFGQLSLKGMVINVPTDLGRIQTQLPRDFSVDKTVMVNIKRRLRYKKCYESENVRPHKILSALQYLTTHETLWRRSGVQLRPEFLEVLLPSSRSADPVALSNDSKPDPERISESSEDSDDEVLSEDDAPDVHAFRDETMIDDGAVDENVRMASIDVAPGEGQRPLSLYLDKNAEEMASPDIFSGYARPECKYSFKKICRVKMRHYKRLVAQRPCNIFFKVRKLQVLDMQQLSWVRLRKSKLQGKPLPMAGQLVDAQGKRDLLNANISFRDFRQLRGTPDYDEQGKKESFAMLRQLGPFTFFYTFSMADMKWPEYLRCLSILVDGKDISLEEAARLSWKERARLVRSDPITSARYHRHRTEALLTAMKSCDALSGKVVDCFWRDEFQQRGTPHTRMAVYVKDAPVLNVDPDHRICEFVSSFITTSAKGISCENLEAQEHKHSKRYCLKKCNQGRSVYCRFGFPKPPMLETTIVRPLPLDIPEDDQRKYRANFDKIKTAVKCLDKQWREASKRSSGPSPPEFPTFDQFLTGLGMTWSEYVLALRASVQKPTMLYQRDPEAIRRNPYNPKLLSLQNSNMDAQFVLDPYSAATYINSYMMKPNLALSKLMKDACESARQSEDNPGQVLRAMGNALLNGQEISIQHAVYVCTGLPFRGSSKDTVFIPSAPPSERTFLVKQDWELRNRSFA